MGEIVGIDSDAVTAHQARFEIEEIPLAPRRRQHFTGVDAKPIAKMRASSFMSAMLRSRWVFSITFAASATFMEGARCTPVVTTEE